MSNAAKATRPFYAVRVVITHACGSTTTRDYVRGSKRMSMSDFASFAVGDLVRLTTVQDFSWTVEPITEAEVA